MRNVAETDHLVASQAEVKGPHLLMDLVEQNRVRGAGVLDDLSGEGTQFFAMEEVRHDGQHEGTGKR